MNQTNQKLTLPGILNITILAILIFFGNMERVLSDSFKPQIRVGSKIITKYDITQKQKFFSIFYGKAFSEKEAIDAIISEIIKLEHSEKQGIRIDSSFISSQVLSFLDKPVGNKQFKDLMKENSVDEEFLFNTVKSSLYWNELIKKEFSTALNITEKDLLEIKPQVTKVINPRVKISVIFIPYQIRGKQNTIKLMDRLVSEIDQGASFSVLARRFSKDTSARAGGSLEWRNISQFNDTVQKQLKKTKVGDITKPISFSDGIYLFLLENRQTTLKPNNIKTLIEYVLIRSFDQEEYNCLSKNKYNTEGPFLLNNLSKKTKTLIETMKVNERKKYNEEYDLLLCRKELDISMDEREELKLQLAAEKIKKFGNGLYLNLRQNALVSFYE